MNEIKKARPGKAQIWQRFDDGGDLDRTRIIFFDEDWHVWRCICVIAGCDPIDEDWYTSCFAPTYGAASRKEMIETMKAYDNRVGLVSRKTKLIWEF